MTLHGDLVYCLSCGYEPPESAAKPVSPAGASAERMLISAAQLGQACLKRVRELAGAIAESERRIAGYRDEAGRLLQIAELSGVEVPAGLAELRQKRRSAQSAAMRRYNDRRTDEDRERAKAQTAAARQPDGTLKCPDCGFATTAATAYGMHRKRCKAKAE